MKKWPVLTLCAAAILAVLALGFAATRYSAPDPSAQSEAASPAAQSPAPDPTRPPAPSAPAVSDPPAPSAAASAQIAQEPSAPPPSETPEGSPSPAPSAAPSAPASEKPAKGVQPAAQDTRPPAPAAAPTAAPTAAPVIADGYSIVTGTGGEFTPGDMVDDSWFDDALYIGDSRTDGLRLFCRTGQADYFAVTGLTVFSALKKTAKDVNFSAQTLGSLLDSKTYGKVLICLGLNECGSRVQNIISAYRGLVDTVREKQPGAAIIIQAVMTCGHAKADDSPNFGPANLNRLNASIKLMAQDSGAYYIDPNTLFADSEGYLPGKFSRDGCHFYAKYYKLWVDWIKCAVYGIPVGAAAGPEAVPSEAPAETAQPAESTPPAEPVESAAPTEPVESAPPQADEPAPPSDPGESAPDGPPEATSDPPAQEPGADAEPSGEGAP